MKSLEELKEDKKRNYKTDFDLPPLTIHKRIYAVSLVHACRNAANGEEEDTAFIFFDNSEDWPGFFWFCNLLNINPLAVRNRCLEERQRNGKKNPEKTETIREILAEREKNKRVFSSADFWGKLARHKEAERREAIRTFEKKEAKKNRAARVKRLRERESNQGVFRFNINRLLEEN